VNLLCLSRGECSKIFIEFYVGAPYKRSAEVFVFLIQKVQVTVCENISKEIKSYQWIRFKCKVESSKFTQSEIK
jgi:hypothetical protein